MNLIFFVSIVFAVLYVALMLIYVYGWVKTKSFVCADEKPETFVSVVISARNEEQNISACLESILKQGYPAHLFEVIVADDDSTDNTVAIVREIQKKASNLSLIQLKDEPNITSFKKRAISKAIGQAKGTLIVTTDADCVAGDRWLSTMVEFYEKEKPKMIVAPVAFHKEKNAFEKMQSLEFTGLMAVTAAAIHFGFPVMCNGANLAYEKEVFKAVNGFEGIDDIVSGDDVLLMNKIKKAFPLGVKYLRSPLAVVHTQACPDLTSFIQQRVRWASKAARGPSFHALASAGIVFCFNICVLFSLIWSVRDASFLSLFGYMILSKCVIDFLLVLLSTKFFDKRSFLIFFIPAQLLYYLYIVIVGVFATLGQYHWKGRKVK